jgi:predicted small metal-binding protein
MARTLGCADVGYDCVFRVTAGDDEDDLILDTAVAHAKTHHPEIVADGKALKSN